MPSYRTGGYWATILSQVKTYKATHEVFVTIQFGNNDQKAPVYEATYSANLKQFVLDVNNAGGIPVRPPSYLFLIGIGDGARKREQDSILTESRSSSRPSPAAPSPAAA